MEQENEDGQIEVIRPHNSQKNTRHEGYCKTPGTWKTMRSQ